MTKRGVGSLVLSLAVLTGVAACDDNPLSEARDTGAYIDVNPVDALVEAGDTTPVIARVMSRYGTPTNESVTAEPCDSKITASVDPDRSDFEVPETFLVVGQALGRSCLVVRGGGLVDTAAVRVVPARLTVADIEAVGSGETAQITPTFYNTANATVTGLTANDLSYKVIDEDIAEIDASGTISGKAPGTTQIVATLKGYGVARLDTFTVNVEAGTFTGTFSPTALAAGGIMTVNAGGIAFDDDTQVSVNGVPVNYWLSRSAEALVFAVPDGVGAGTEVVVSNMGPNQIAAIFTADISDGEPNEGPATAIPIALGDSAYTTVSEADASDIFVVDLAAPTTVNINMDWLASGADIDVYFYDASFDFNSFGDTYPCATGNNPESCSVDLPAGKYYMEVYWYDGEGPVTVKFKITP